MRMRPAVKLQIAVVAVAAATISPHRVGANPEGSQVVGGSATIQGEGTPGVTVNQSSDKAIINWQSFNIARGEFTRFNQPSEASVALNRVTGDKNPSSIFGSLSANGRVFLVNPEGFIFGPSARINTAAFLATTHDIKNEDFLAGRYDFNISGNPRASIINQGTISVADTGIAALVAPGVRNDGIITARVGKVSLASANAFSLDLYGDNLINFALNDEIASQVIDVATGKPMTSLVENRGKLSAHGGTVAMTAVTARALVDSVINNSGVVEANSVGVKNGRIVLGGQTARSKTASAPRQKVVVSGKLDVSGDGARETGGKLEVTGESIDIKGATINASGSIGGGKVLVGGDVGGGTPNPAAGNSASAALEPGAVATASGVTVDAGTSIDASALASGDGGKVVVWSDGETLFDGAVVARGGNASGNGGFVEISGHDRLGFNGSVDLSAPNGERGILLLDPRDVTIGSSGTWIVTVAALQAALATSDVVVNTSAAGTDAGDITVAESINWSSANKLTLSANRDIIVLNDVAITNLGDGDLEMRADNIGSGVGTVAFQGTGHVNFSASTGLVSIFYNPAVGYTLPTNYVPFVSTNGPVQSQLTAYMLVNDSTDLQNMQQNLLGTYALGRDIDASATASWNGGAGFIPIGRDYTSAEKLLILQGACCIPNPFFGGTIDGLGHIISELTINSSAAEVGFIGASVGQFRNIGLVDANISGTGRVGALVGYANGGSITGSFSTGTVSGGPGSQVGGLIGDLSSGVTLSQSYSTAAVAGTSASSVGGLVGQVGFFVPIAESYSTGSVSGGSQVGGLVGRCTFCSATNSYWDFQTSGQLNSAVGTGLTTAQLQSGLPAGFSSSDWATAGGYPFLLWQGPQTTSAVVLTGAAPTSGVPDVTQAPANANGLRNVAAAAMAAEYGQVYAFKEIAAGTLKNIVFGLSDVYTKYFGTVAGVLDTIAQATEVVGAGVVVAKQQPESAIYMEAIRFHVEDLRVKSLSVVVDEAYETIQGQFYMPVTKATIRNKLIGEAQYQGIPIIDPN